MDADISRIEQSIEHASETKKRHQQELEQTQLKLDSLADELAEQAAAQQASSQQMQTMQADLEALNAQHETVAKAVATAEKAELDWRDAWQELMHVANQPSHQVETHTQRIEFLSAEISRLQKRKQKYQTEHGELLENRHEFDLDAIERRLAAHAEALDDCQRRLREVGENIAETRASIDDLSIQLDDRKAAYQQIKNQLATLQALQDAALKAEHPELQTWLNQHQYEGLPRLADQLEVESGWERAVETVLEGYLEAVCTRDLERVAGQLGELKKGSVMFFESSDQSEPARVAEDTLAGKITASQAVKQPLNNILVADNLRQALAMRKQLAAGQSVITPEGVWMSPVWIRYSHAVSAAEGVLSRKADIADLEQRLIQLDKAIVTLKRQHQQASEHLSAHEQQREQAQQAHNLAFQQHAQIDSELARCQSVIEHWQQRDTQLRAAIEEALNSLDDYQRQKQIAVENRQSAQVNLDALDVSRRQLLARKEKVISECNERKQQASQLQESCHALQLEIADLRTREATCESTYSRLQAQQSEHNHKLEQLSTALLASDTPLREFSETLQQTLAKKLLVERRLTDSRQALAQIETDIRDKDEKRMGVDNQIAKQREALNDQRLQWQELKVHAQTIKEQLEQTDCSPAALAESLPPDASVQHWQQQVLQLEEKIKRLGAINLAAIDEYKQQSERKQYLDAQHEDLTKALNTLETAIDKIDRETKERFKDTFERINAHIQHMYPRLFPGGKAYLEMVGDDLLSAGVTIMARPPGKRVSSIQLLSGGEKALTAAALVLAIFELSPAPFCLLDEVDAPLDDANVGRFCDLIKDMSERVQFIFVTHNKSTMAYADHMLGVTMHEPGVSRLVSVDIEAAVKLADAG